MNHIPDKYEHLVRFYGHYSNRSRGARKQVRQEQGTVLPTCITISAVCLPSRRDRIAATTTSLICSFVVPASSPRRKPGRSSVMFNWAVRELAAIRSGRKYD